MPHAISNAKTPKERKRPPPAERLSRKALARQQQAKRDGDKRAMVRRIPSEWWRSEFKAGRTNFPPPAEHPLVACACNRRCCDGTFYPSFYGEPLGTGRHIGDKFVSGWSDDCIAEAFALYERSLVEDGVLDAPEAYPRRQRRDETDSGEGAVLMKRLLKGRSKAKVKQILLADESVASLGIEIERFLESGGKDVQIIYANGSSSRLFLDADGSAFEAFLDREGKPITHLDGQPALYPYTFEEHHEQCTENANS